MPDENTHTQSPPVEGGTHTFGAPDGTGTFTPPQGAADAPVPVIPGYEVLESVGSGGMGRVYRARQLATGRVVAVKLILAGEFADAIARKRFKAEIEITATLSHPHIVQLYEAGEADGRAFLSCEFVAGGSLAARLDGTPWEAKRAARLLVPLVQAVGHAHEAGIVHRDLKPANILLTTDGQAKVADFDIAKQLDSNFTNTGAVMGTPSYMPPEQAGSAQMVGAEADVYSLGAILYELLTGRPPFKGADFVETIDLVRTQEPVPPRVLQPKLPRDIETICLKCLQKAPEKRYPTAEALAEDLERFLEGRPIVARPVGAIERGWRWAKRNPAVASLMAAVVLVFTVGSVVAWYLAAKAEGQEAAANQERMRARDARKDAEEEQKRAADERKNAEAAREQAEEFLYAGKIYQAHVAAVEYRTDRLTQMLDDTRPKAGQPDRRGWEWHYLHRLTHSWTEEHTLNPIPASDPNPESPLWRFSSDLSRVVVQYPSDFGTKFAIAGLYDTSTGKRLRELPELKNQFPTSGFGPPVLGPALSPDLTFAAVTESYKKLLQLPAGVAGPPREVDRCRVRLLDLRVPKEREDVTPFPELEVVPSVYVADRGNRVLLYLTGDLTFGQLGAAPVRADPKNYPRLEVWERGREGPPVRTRIPGVPGSVFVNGVSPDGKTVVVESIETAEGGKGDAPSLRRTDLWDVSGQPVRRARLMSAPAALNFTSTTTFSAGGRALTVTEVDYAINVFDGRTGEPLGRWVPPRDTMAPVLPSFQVTDDGQRLAFSGKNETIVVGERTGNGLVSTAPGNFRLPDRDAVGTWRATVLRPPWGANGLLPGSQLALSADGRRLLDGKGTTYRAWDLARTEFASSWPEFISLGGESASATASAHGHRVLYNEIYFPQGNAYPPRAFRFRVRDPQRTAPDRDFTVEGKNCLGTISADGQRVLLTDWSPTNDSPLASQTRWSLRAANDPARELRGGNGQVQFSGDGRWMFEQVGWSVGMQSARVYRASDGELASTISSPPENTVADTWMTPGGTVVLVTHAKVGETKDKVPDPIALTLRFYDAATGAARGSWTPPTTWPLTRGGPDLNEATWAPDLPDPFYSTDGCKLGLSRVGPDGAVRAWVLDATTWALEAEFTAPATGRQIAPTRRLGGGGPAGQLRAGGTFGPGARVSVWAGDSDLLTWAIPGAPAVRLTGLESGTAVAFTANGRRAFTLDREYGFGRDLTVRVWNPSDGRELIAMRFRIRPC